MRDAGTGSIINISSVEGGAVSRSVRHLKPEGLHNNPAYTHVVAARGEVVFISGQVAVDAEGNVVGVGDLAAQTEQVMRNLQIALEAAGATFADVTKITTFVVDYEPGCGPPSPRCGVATCRPSNPPASTLVGVSALAAPELLIEIEATAVID